MAYVAMSSLEVQVDQPVNSGMMTKIKDNFDFLYSQTAGQAGLNNPSFEVDADNDKVPDNWTKSLFAGGAASITTVSSYVDHGEKAFGFTHPGGNANGGGMLKSDYVGCSTSQPVQISFSLLAIPANCRSKVQVEWYKNDFSTIGGISTIFDSSGLTTVYDRYYHSAIAPTSAKWMTVNLIGGATESTVAGVVYFDNIDLSNLGQSLAECGGNIIGGSVDQRSATLSTVTTPSQVMRTIETRLPGDFRISFEGLGATGGAGQNDFALRKNTSILSTFATPGAVYANFSFDATGLVIGDKIDILARCATGGGTWATKNFFLCVKRNEFCVASTSSVTT